MSEDTTITPTPVEQPIEQPVDYTPAVPPDDISHDTYVPQAPVQMVNFVRYYAASGQIFASGHCKHEDTLREPVPDAGHGTIVVNELPLDITAVYVVSGQVVPRPDYPATLTGNALSGIVVPTAMKVNGNYYDVQEDTVTLDFPNPGVYKIELESWPYKNVSFEITI